MDFTIWFLIGAAFVFFMQAGFAMVETGFTRAKNAGNIIMKNLIDFCIGAVVFMLLGFSLLVGLEAVGHFCGVPNLGMFADFDAFITNENGLASNFVFNLVFCATAATIVYGAMAERTRFAAYCVYSALISLVVYPIEAGWIWGLGDNAWLTSMGFVDFAGSTAIHMVGGTAALIGAAMEGARLGKYERDDNGKVIKVNAIQGHNIPIGALGVFILWFGWYGFNGAAATTIESLAIIFVNTTISPALAVVSCMIFTWVRSGKPDVSMCLNASLAGLVAITAGCHIVDPIGATVIGVVSGILVVVVAEGLDKIFHVDDPVGAVAVHFANGIWGTLAVGLFAAQNYQEGAPGALTDPSQLGVFYGGNGYLLGMQVAGIVTVITWASVCMIIIFGAIKYVPVMIKFKTVNPAKVLAYGKTWNGLRAGAEEEVIGLDIMEHGLTSAYADFQLNVPILDDGKVGAGKIFVSDIENVMRVRTGETGEKALDNAT